MRPHADEGIRHKSCLMTYPSQISGQPKPVL